MNPFLFLWWPVDWFIIQRFGFGWKNSDFEQLFIKYDKNFGIFCLKNPTLVQLFINFDKKIVKLSYQYFQSYN